MFKQNLVQRKAHLHLDKRSQLLSWNFPRQISSIRILLGLGCDYGLSVAACLEGTGLNEAQVASSNILVDPSQEFQVIRNLLSLLGNDLPLGLEAGLRYHPTTFGLWGYALMSSPTVRDAVIVGTRYLQLTSVFVQISFKEIDGEGRMTANDDSLPADIRDFLVERDSAILFNMVRDMGAGQVPYIRLEFKQDKPKYAEKYTDIFGIAASFNQPLNRISVPLAMADLKLPQGDSSIINEIEQQCQNLLERRKGSTGIANEVRNKLLSNPAQMPNMEIMAQEFHVTARTLRTKLAQQGTDYETLTTEVRCSLAEILLKNTDIPLEHIAMQLGYAEPSSFFRAFKRWFTLTPRQYRQKFRK